MMMTSPFRLSGGQIVCNPIFLLPARDIFNCPALQHGPWRQRLLSCFAPVFYRTTGFTSAP